MEKTITMYKPCKKFHYRNTGVHAENKGQRVCVHVRMHVCTHPPKHN